jgi:hypothetical protein
VIDATRPNGCAWYVGAPQSGKTTLASVHARKWSEALGRPVVVVDSEGTRDFVRVEHFDDVRELAGAVWGQGSWAAITPEDVRQVDELAGAVRRGGNVVLLVDEAHYWLASARSTGLLRLMRSTQHSRLRVLLTTQHLSGDVPQSALACDPDLFVFRTTSPRSLDVLEKQFRCPASVARALEPRTFIPWRV